MFLSVIVATYNRWAELEELLQALRLQTYPKDQFELVVVDDGSTDQTESLVRRFSEATDLTIRYVYQDNQGPGPSRNLGMSQAQGDVFVLTDSDCIPPPDWLEHIAQAMADPSVDAFGGPDRSHPDFPPLLKAIDYSMTSFIGTGGTRGSTCLKLARYYPRSFNMGFRRSVYERIGGMGTLRHGQDMEFSNRMHRQGLNVVFLPDIAVYHKRRTSLRRFFKQVFNWGVARVNLARIDSQMLKPVHTLPALALLGFALLTLALPFSILVRRIWTGAVLAGVALLCGAGIQAFSRYRSLHVALLSMVTLATQVLAYGLGLWYGAIRSITSHTDEAVRGFTKNYYK